MLNQHRTRRPNFSKDVEDIELQKDSTPFFGHDIKPAYLEAIENLFSLPRDQVSQWPGITAYCRFLESCFEPALEEEYKYLWKALNRSTPQSATECWPWFNATCLALKKLQQDDHSIQDVWNKVKASQDADRSLEPDHDDSSKIAVFATLCWATMALQPILLWKEFRGKPSLAVKYHGKNCSGLKLSFVERPIPAAFREFQHTLPGARWHQPIGSSSRSSSNNNENSVALYVSTLNYATLKRISKIRLEWVSDLSSHLDFDSTSRVLYIFRFPSFCALNTLRTNNIPILEGYVKSDL